MWAAIWVFQTLTYVGVVLFATLLALLPDGRFRHARERRFLLAAWVVVAFPTLVMVSNRLMLTDELSFAGVSGIPSPLFFEALEPYGEAFDALNTLGFSIVVGAIALCSCATARLPPGSASRFAGSSPGSWPSSSGRSASFFPSSGSSPHQGTSSRC